jgi:6-phosphogluconate dehydrogenase
MAGASFGLMGLGVMGQNLALNVEEHGFPVAVWNHDPAKTNAFIQHQAGKRFVGAATLEELMKQLERPRRILLMIKAGAPVDESLKNLAPLLDRGDVIVDGGNSFFKDTQRREADYRARGLHFVGAGVSGGEEGARRGPCLMPGGAREAYGIVQPVFDAIAARSAHGACVAWVGPDGAGHFVKMVHNGIEYGDLQLIAEAYDLLRRVGGLGAEQAGEVFDRWNRGRLESFLIEIAGRVLARRDPETGRPLVDLIEDEAGQKGTGRWTAEEALELAVAIPTIAAAIDARVLSGLKKERVQAAPLLPGPTVPVDKAAAQELVGALEDALWLARVCGYAQGMNLIRAASKEYNWNVDLAEMTRIWTGGCIIRAKLLDDLRAAYQARPDLPNLLVDEKLRGLAARAQAGLRRAVSLAHAAGVPVPCFSASLNYFDSYRTARLPQNLTQAQRDAFGAHTYVRTDHPERGPQHTDWLK